MTGLEKRKYESLLKECESEEKAQTEYIRWKCLTDLYFLGTEILGLGVVKKRVYPPFHRWLCSKLELDGDKMILVPRKHAKTTWSNARVVQRVLQTQGRIRILMLSRTERIVTWNLAIIKRHLARPLLIRYFPDILVQPGKDYKNWLKSTTNELQIKEYDDVMWKEPQVVAYGSAASFTGSAVDEIVLDDYIDDDTCTSASKMLKAEDDWRYLQPLLDAGGSVTVVGTFYHYNDLYNLMIKEKHFPKDRVFVRSAVENGKILYPTMFTQKRLDRLKKIETPYIYSCQYMLNPIPKDDQIFPGPQPTCVTLPADEYRYYIVMDPAATVSGTSDETGVVVAAVNKHNIVYYVEATGFKKDGAGKADWLIQKCLQYKPVSIGIEFGLQKDLQYIIKTRTSDYEQRYKVRVPLHIEEIKIQNKKAKADRINRTLGYYVRAGNVQIVESGCRELVRQMDTFTGKGNEKDDVVDAAALLFPLVGTFGYPTSMIERVKAEQGTIMELINARKNKTSEWRKNFVA